MSERKLYRVEVVHVIYVVADSKERAEKWADESITDWGSDPSEYVEAMPVPNIIDLIPPEQRDNLPWAADGLSEDESQRTVGWWIDRPISNPE